MQYSEVHFKNFSVDPTALIKGLPQYKTNFFPLDWTVVVLNRGDPQSINEWSNENAVGKWHVENLRATEIIVAFEEEYDAVLFKLSHVEV